MGILRMDPIKLLSRSWSFQYNKREPAEVEINVKSITCLFLADIALDQSNQVAVLYEANYDMIWPQIQISWFLHSSPPMALNQIIAARISQQTLDSFQFSQLSKNGKRRKRRNSS